MAVKSSKQTTLIIVLSVVIVALAALMIFLILQAGNKTADTGRLPEKQETEITDASNAMKNAVSSQGEFDLATAQKVEGTPEEWTTKYYEACNKADWATAFELQPTARKQASSVEAFSKQLSGYGITGYEIVSVDAPNDTELNITVDQTTSQFGTFTSIWTYVKDGNDWYVKSKAVAGMR